jgi:hypothetical protein
MYYLSKLERFKIYIHTHTNYRSYMFRSTTVIRELVLNLTKVTFILGHSVKLRRCMLFGDVLSPSTTIRIAPPPPHGKISAQARNL